MEAFQKAISLAGNNTLLDRQILDTSPFGVSIIALGGLNRLYVNQQLVEMSRADSAEHLMAQTVAESYTDPEYTEKMISAANNSSVIPVLEAERIGPNGYIWWSRIRSSIIEFDGEKSIISWHEDITEKRQTSLHLQEKSFALENVLSNIVQGVAMFDKDKKLTLWNQHYNDALNFPSHLLKVGVTNYELALFLAERGDYGAGSPADLVKDRLNLLWNTESSRSEITPDNGRTYDVLFQRTDDSGLVITYTDISDKKHSEIALKNSEERFRAIFDNSPHSMYLLDTKGTFLLANKVLERLNINDDLLQLGVNGHDVLPEEEAVLFDKMNKEVLVSRQAVESEITLSQPDGNTRTLLSVKFPVFDSNSEIVSIGVINTDITARNRDRKALRISEEKLQNQVTELQDRENTLTKQASELVMLADDLAVARDELELLNQNKNRLFSIIAHDLKSPFNSLLGFSELLATMSEKLDREKIVEYAGLINTSGNQLFQLLENLLTWSRAQMDSVQINLVDFDLVKLVNTNLDTLSTSAENKNVQLICSIPAMNITADKDMIDTVVRNLLTNGIKFSNAGRTVSIHAENNNNEVILIVSDDGVGMTDKQKQNLFKISDQSTTTGTDGETGTGLGLLICKEFVEKHSGKIDVESTEGLGTTFRISIPVSTH